jgi:hypothetical protein
MEFWTKKFNNTQAGTHDFDKTWLDRLLIVTEKRLFIVTRKDLGSEDDNKDKGRLSKQQLIDAELEIVDSIPMEEIISVQVEREAGVWDENPHSATETPGASVIQRAIKTLASLRRKYRKRQDDEEVAEEDRRAAQQAVERNLWASLKQPPTSAEPERSRPGRIPPAHPDFCEPILRIETDPSGFNRGQTYYFLLRKQDCPCLDIVHGLAPLRNRTDAEFLAARFAALAARRGAEHARETRFLRLQRRLRRAWDSVAFNLAVLLLIASNFVFTVAQLENKDPQQQSFFEHVDLAYTIIFALGARARARRCHYQCQYRLAGRY